MATAVERDEFVNQTKGFIGVITIQGGKEKAVAVRPEGNVWLSEEEQVLTANAPRNDDDNPFANGSLKLVTKAKDVVNRRPIGRVNGSPVPDAPPAPPAPAPEPQESEGEQPEEPSNVAPPPTPAPSRAEADAKRAAEEAERQKAAQAQAAAGPIPAAETGASVRPSGAPEVGKRARDEEVATPEAAAAKEPAKE